MVFCVIGTLWGYFILPEVSDKFSRSFKDSA